MSDLPEAMSTDETANRGAGISAVSVLGWAEAETRDVSTLSGADITSVSETFSAFLSQSDTEPWGAGRTTKRRQNTIEENFI